MKDLDEAALAVLFEEPVQADARRPAAGVGTDHLARDDGPGLRPTTPTGETPLGT